MMSASVSFPHFPCVTPSSRYYRPECRCLVSSALCLILRIRRYILLFFWWAMSGQLVEVSFSVSMSPRGVFGVVGSVYSLSGPLLLFGFLWFLGEASACCLEEVPGSVLVVTSFTGADWFWKP